MELPRNDISLTVRTMEVGQLEVTECHFLGFMTSYVQKSPKVQKVDFGPGNLGPIKSSD